jgi:hypothetical protein
LSVALGSDAFSGEKKAKTPEPALTPAKIERVNELYRQKTASIFETKCFDCHSERTKYPWYYVIPGIKQLIEHDTHEGREHLDLSKGFPFGGKFGPRASLEEIAEVIEDGEMPPFLYNVAHWSWVKDDEKRVILDWARQSIEVVSQTEK